MLPGRRSHNTLRAGATDRVSGKRTGYDPINDHLIAHKIAIKWNLGRAQPARPKHFSAAPPQTRFCFGIDSRASSFSCGQEIEDIIYIFIKFDFIVLSRENGHGMSFENYEYFFFFFKRVMRRWPKQTLTAAHKHLPTSSSGPCGLMSNSCMMGEHSEPEINRKHTGWGVSRNGTRMEWSPMRQSEVDYGNQVDDLWLKTRADSRFERRATGLGLAYLVAEGGICSRCLV